MRVARTRRAFLFAAASSSVAFAASGKGQEAPGDRQRFLDPTTEFEVVRLTGLDHESFLPANSGRTVSRRGDFLICASDRGSGVQAWRIDTKSGKARQLSELDGLKPSTLTLAAQDRQLFCIASGKLVQINMGTLREREIAVVDDSAQRISVSEDGQTVLVAEGGAQGHRLRIVRVTPASVQTTTESNGPITGLAIRPKQTGAFYCCDGSLFTLSLDGKVNRRLRTAAGAVLEAQWSPDGSSILYLLKPPAANALTELHEITPERDEDKLLAKTSQFVRFAPNGDASVFLGACGSKAQPTLLLLLRSVRRELTICEHKCSDARLANPTFSPNSQRIFFQTDRHGKMVIYSMNVDRLVEETLQESA